MAKNYVFVIPDIKKERTYDAPKVVNGNIETEKKSEPLRELHKRIYTELFQLAAAQKKKISEALLCQDCVGQVKNLADRETAIMFTEQDIGFLKEGFELTAGLDEYGRLRRPNVWLSECRDLFDQINNPVEEETYKNQAGKAKK